MPEGQNIEQIPVSPEASPAPENISIPEKKVEQTPKPDAQKPVEKPKKLTPQSIPQQQSQTVTAEESEITLHKVESILSDGMEKIYLSMDAGTQAAFKAKGEETSKKISGLLSQTKVQIKQIIGLIADWLRIVPKINKYYIEQEAKIKADAIMEIYNRRKQ